MTKLPFFRSDKIDLLKKTQENLEASQRNNELLASAIQRLVAAMPSQEYLDASQQNSALISAAFGQLVAPQAEQESLITEEEKKMAAYALNLCTVSVSQIIDYDDAYFLECEYDAILNNLNLEHMPKDEALLSILKQLLDVITFFRIQEGDKKMLEKEYQQRMKNAIWNAAPNFGLIVAGGSPLTMAISLASQIGIGYMNYRKEKANIQTEKERKQWELQRSAIEQFNGLRRELFDTAWRLAEKYRFPDSYRLTERQISQYNAILMDPDNMRRCERLEYIADWFEAYPPFWYYLGSASYAASYDDRLTDNEKTTYIENARRYFEKFLSGKEFDILREDQLVAACALEYFGLLTPDEKKFHTHLLERARQAAGNAFDVLELCAMAYLDAEEPEKASKILRMLVNEGYNTELNAQILSGIYVAQAINSPMAASRMKYKTLQLRAPNVTLYPMPPLDIRIDDFKYIENAFLLEQRGNLRSKYAITIRNLVEKYQCKFDLLWKINGNISEDMIKLLQELSSVVNKLLPSMSNTYPLEQTTLSDTDIQDFRNSIEVFSRRSSQKSSEIFKKTFKPYFTAIAINITETLNKIDNVSDLSKAESELDSFINKLGLVTNILTTQAVIDSSIEAAVYGKNYENLRQLRMQKDKALSIFRSQNIKERIITASKNSRTKASLYLEGESEFDQYCRKVFTNKLFHVSPVSNTSRIIAILNDTKVNDIDLIFTPDALFTIKGKASISFAKYCDITFKATDSDKHQLQIGTRSYHHNDVDINALYDLIRQLSEVSGSMTRDDSLATEIEEKINSSATE